MGQQDTAWARLLVMEKQVSLGSKSLAARSLRFGQRQRSGRSEGCTDAAGTSAVAGTTDDAA